MLNLILNKQVSGRVIDTRAKRKAERANRQHKCAGIVCKYGREVNILGS